MTDTLMCDFGKISRARGQSAAAHAAYITATCLTDADGIRHRSYASEAGRRERVKAVGVMLPEGADQAWGSVERLVQEMERKESRENSVVGHKIMVALPYEIPENDREQTVRDFIADNFTANGLCAIYALHDKADGSNPHAHIIVANHALDKKGRWAQSEKKEYVLDENGERVPLLDKNGEVKRTAHGSIAWKRRSVKTEKTTIWRQKDNYETLRGKLQDTLNAHLEAAGSGLRVDHRSYARRGVARIPTVHEGYAAREIEARGGVSELAWQNREIRALNKQIEAAPDSEDAQAPAAEVQALQAAQADRMQALEDEQAQEAQEAQEAWTARMETAETTVASEKSRLEMLRKSLQSLKNHVNEIKERIARAFQPAVPEVFEEPRPGARGGKDDTATPTPATTPTPVPEAEAEPDVSAAALEAARLRRLREQQRKKAQPSVLDIMVDRAREQGSAAYTRPTGNETEDDFEFDY